MKQCTKCKEVKCLDEFHNCESKKDGKMSQCKSCRNAYNRKKSSEIGYDVLYKRALSNPNYKEREKKRREKNRAKAVARVAEWRRNNPGCRRREYERNKQSAILRASKWKSENPKARKRIAREYAKRFNSNPENKPIIVCRKLLSRVLAQSDRKRSAKTRTEEQLGYTKEQLKKHIEGMFSCGMSWSNHGDWHVDHIKPVSLMLSEGITDPKIINALENLQPLWATENLIKGAKYDA